MNFVQALVSLLDGFPLEILSIVEKYPMVYGSRPEFTKLALVAEVR